MIAVLVALVTVTCLALVAWSGTSVLRDRPVIARQLLLAAVVELLLVVQAVAQGVVLAGAHRSVSGGLFWGYVAAGLVLLPGAAAWAFAERTRWSSVVLALAALVVAFLQLRLVQVWRG